MTTTLAILAYAALGYVLVAAAFGIGFATIGMWRLLRVGRSGERRLTMTGRAFTPLPVSIVFVVGYDDADVADRLKTLMTQYYPAFEVVLVSDGPLSAATSEAIARFQVAPVDLIYRPLVPTAKVTACYHGATVPRLIVIEKERATYADALNAGINAAGSPYLCVIGPSTYLDRAAVARLMSMVEEDPERIVAVSGIERLINGCEIRNGDVEVGNLPQPVHLVVSALEGMRTTLTNAGAAPWTGVVAASTQCLLLNRHAVLQIGGVEPIPNAEHADLLFRLRWTLNGSGRLRRTAFVPDPVAWVRVPEEASGAARAARQSVEGEMRALGRRVRLIRPMTLRQIGAWLASLGWGLALAAPVVEAGGAFLVTAAYGLGLVGFSSLLWFGMAAFAFRTAYSSVAVFMHDMTVKRYPRWRDLLGLFTAAVIEPFLIRPRAAWWTLHALGAVLRPVSTNRGRVTYSHSLGQAD